MAIKNVARLFMVVIEVMQKLTSVHIPHLEVYKPAYVTHTLRIIHYIPHLDAHKPTAVIEV